MALTEDRRRMAMRLMVLQASVVVAFAALAVSFWFLQIVQHTQYEEMAENNHQRTLALRAPRGVLFDRNGRVLVENRHSFNVSIVREHTKDLDRTIRLLAGVGGLDADVVRQIVARHRHEPTYRPIVVIEDASLSQVAAIMARRLDFELPDVVVEQVPTRQYPIDALAAHVFGYVGEASETQIGNGIRSGSIIGQSGVERVYNDLLMGEDGARRVVVNSVGREIRTEAEVPPKEGRRVQLTIDYDLQKAAEDGFRHAGFNGSAVILDPRNGEVLSLVSLPAYDPNDFAAGIDSATWASLNNDQLKPLQNRAIQGRYSPGSTFKLVVATAALEEGLVTPDYKVYCGGSATFFGRNFLCHLKGGHGVIDMRHAIEKSCNVYFYTLGNMLGVDRLHKWAETLGLVGKTGIDLPNEQESLVPSTEWKMRRFGEKWYAGETISVAIGQGQVSVTPVSLGVMMATIANGGTRVIPHIVRAVDEGGGWKMATPPAVAEHAAFRPQTLSALHDGLWMVVNAAGTGGRARIPGRDVAGKTGTAQVISIQGRQAARGSGLDLRDHGWFVFFAPKDDPEIAGVIFGEHSEHGYLGAPIARHVIETYFAKKEGSPLPVLVPTPAPAPPEADPDTAPVEIGPAIAAAPRAAAGPGTN
ncbi:MAG: penicillin-binding protein 2 [Acidobacteria bacterium RIFCSPLOWO2_02_FULL_68_18]|nr:MAG: penicillin-binding protein 2 [Acidobacteria bacterium RIFCSPLOWO2_02_FULL_68_18]OFW51533.1 MAG: penicillin-binding protein 2 [Acidobacteria bacterium RIFCSPLOWO2_12_FULL_68_19]